MIKLRLKTNKAKHLNVVGIQGLRRIFVTESDPEIELTDEEYTLLSNTVYIKMFERINPDLNQEAG